MLQADHMLLLGSIAAVPFYLPTVHSNSSLLVFSAPCLFPFVFMFVFLMIAIHTSEGKALSIVFICIFLVGRILSHIYIYTRVCVCVHALVSQFHVCCDTIALI